MTRKLLAAFFFVALGAASPAHAGNDTQKIGSWSVSTEDPTMMYAVTHNEGGSLFGQYCYPDRGSCLWLLSTAQPCEKEHEYPVLANSDGGAVALKLSCRGSAGTGEQLRYIYVFSDFDEITEVVKKGSKVGFALPFQDDQFKVVSFDLDGAHDAMKEMLNSAKEAMDRANSKKGGKNTP